MTDRRAAALEALDSLPPADRRSVRCSAELSRRDVEVGHLVGGGARNTLLRRLTADACALLRLTLETRTYRPSAGAEAAWRAAEDRLPGA